MELTKHVLEILKQEFYKQSIDFNISSEDPDIFLIDEFIKNHFPERDWRGEQSILAEQIVSSLVNGVIDGEKTKADTILYDIKSNNTYYSVKCTGAGSESFCLKRSPTFLRQLLLVPLYINDRHFKAKDIAPIIQLLKIGNIKEAVKQYDEMYPGSIIYVNNKVYVESNSDKYFSLCSVWKDKHSFNIKSSKPLHESVLLERIFNAIIEGKITFDKKCTVVHSIKSKKLLFGNEDNLISYKLLTHNSLINVKKKLINKINKLTCTSLLSKIEKTLNTLGI